jgi:signal transduction histidine kinase
MISDKGLVPRFTISEHLPKINADYERTLQVLRNLISNSTKFTSWGTVSLKIALDEKDNNYVCFELKDTGQGIPEENKSMIFSRFYQVDSSMARKIGGSGLGLSICKGLIDSMGGKIWFESEVGQGSTFYFTLPVLKENNVSK